MTRLMQSVVCCLLGGLAAAQAAALTPDEYLPPERPWAGPSESLQLPADHPWATPAERSGLTETPTYDDTVVWLRRLVAAAPELSMESLGKTAEGRDIWMVIAARGVEPEAAAVAASGRPVVYVQAGIHAGEIDGKDAGLMLLRDMTVLDRETALLDQAVLLFVPILNADGHERRSRFNRINQRGPLEMGWRTNARNLNLNRDHAKLETEEVRAVVAAWNRWRPDLFLDLHVTDGADYQYDMTWSMPSSQGWSPAIADWCSRRLEPGLTQALKTMGHEPHEYIWAKNHGDLSDGALVTLGSPRYSTTYAAARHLPAILVEGHSLKPYRQRVLATYVLLRSSLKLAIAHGSELRRATARDRKSRPSPVVLDWRYGETPRTETRPFKGIGSAWVDSPVSGSKIVRWNGEPETQKVEFVFKTEPASSVSRPAGYVIPPGWGHIAEKLRLHGIEVETLGLPEAIDAQVYHLPEVRAAGLAEARTERGPTIYEGRLRIDPGPVDIRRVSITVPAGSHRVNTDQPLGTLAILLLEPESPDSLLQWGYFLEIMTQPEYAQAYIMAPMAETMLAADPQLALEFRERVASDPDFASSPKARLRWFYEKTPFFDSRFRVYPVVREIAATH